jgi:hypothetical protein
LTLKRASSLRSMLMPNAGLSPSLRMIASILDFYLSWMSPGEALYCGARRQQLGMAGSGMILSPI